MKGSGLFVLLLFFGIKLFSQSTCKYDTDGFAFQLNTSNGGPIIEYQYLLRDKLRITAFGGAGVEMGEVDSKWARLGYAVGINMEYGRKHRIIIGLNYGTHSVGYDADSDSSRISINKHVYSGSSFVAGYKGTSCKGFIWQIYFGIVYEHNPFGNDKNYFFGPTGGLGFGYKF